MTHCGVENLMTWIIEYFSEREGSNIQPWSISSVRQVKEPFDVLGGTFLKERCSRTTTFRSTVINLP